MKLLEEKGLREKIINECIMYENELYQRAQNFVETADHTRCVKTRINDLSSANELIFASARISDLRMNLMQLLDNEKVAE